MMQVQDAAVGAALAPHPAERVHEGVTPSGHGSTRRRGWIVRRALLAADMTGLVIALLLAQACFSGRRTLPERLEPTRLWVFLVLALPAWTVAAKLYSLYDRDEERTDHSTADDVTGVFHLVTIAVWVTGLAGHFSGLLDPSWRKLAGFWIFAVLLIPLARAGARWVCRRRGEYVQNTLIVGAGEIGQLIAKKYSQHPEYGINLVGFVDDNPRERVGGLSSFNLLGSFAALPSIVAEYEIERVVIAFSNESTDRTVALIRSLRDLNVQIDIVPRFFEVVPPSVGVHNVEGLALVSLPPFHLSRSSKLLKRTLDVGLAALGLLLTSPVLIGAALLIKLDSTGPVFFRQERMGVGDKSFRMIKFRTMVSDADERKQEIAHLNKHLDGGDARMFKVRNDPRVTRIGRALRRYSIDEIPQLFNVLRGEMSLVGPRPLILDEDRFVCDWGRQRLTLQPGITGPWQVLGRTNIPFQEMVTLDYLYVTSWSLMHDVRLLLQTLPAVVRTRAET